MFPYGNVIFKESTNTKDKSNFALQVLIALTVIFNYSDVRINNL